jgi:hypothetical protein
MENVFSFVVFECCFKMSQRSETDFSKSRVLQFICGSFSHVVEGSLKVFQFTVFIFTK